VSQLDPTIPPAPGRRRPKPGVWIAAALILVALIAGTIGGLAAHADSAAAQDDPSISEPDAPEITEPAATEAAHHKPKHVRTKKPTDDTPPPTYRYTSCDQVWAGGQGPFKKGEAGYTKQLDPDGDGIACPSHPED
jgi:hypothetical protein